MYTKISNFSSQSRNASKSNGILSEKHIKFAILFIIYLKSLDFNSRWYIISNNIQTQTKRLCTRRMQIVELSYNR